MIKHETDQKILTLLQQDSSVSISALSEQVNLSVSACHRRVRQLEKKGVIQGYSARLNGEALGLESEALVEITLDSQSDTAMRAFEAAVANMPEVLECFLVTGEADYMVRIAAKTNRLYERIHRRTLANLPHVATMKTIFILRSVRPWRGYCLG